MTSTEVKIFEPISDEALVLKIATANASTDYKFDVQRTTKSWMRSIKEFQKTGKVSYNVSPVHIADMIRHVVRLYDDMSKNKISQEEALRFVHALGLKTKIQKDEYDGELYYVICHPWVKDKVHILFEVDNEESNEITPTPS